MTHRLGYTTKNLPINREEMKETKQNNPKRITPRKKNRNPSDPPYPKKIKTMLLICQNYAT